MESDKHIRIFVEGVGHALRIPVRAVDDGEIVGEQPLAMLRRHAVVTDEEGHKSELDRLEIVYDGDVPVLRVHFRGVPSSRASSPRRDSTVPYTIPRDSVAPPTLATASLATRMPNRPFLRQVVAFAEHATNAVERALRRLRIL